MLLYPFSQPIILTTDIFVEFGGKTGTFSNSQLQASYLVAETQATKYIGAPLLPINVTGSYPFMGKHRVVTDYGYVNQLHEVTVWSRNTLSACCSLQDNRACGFVYSDTYGYIDFKQVALICGLSFVGVAGGAIVVPNNPYQIQISYNAGLPTGTANHPNILEALTILAQIDLNEKDPGNSGINESTGDVGVQDWKSLDYSESRGKHTLIKTDLGDSAKAQRARKLINSVITRATKPLLA